MQLSGESDLNDLIGKADYFASPICPLRRRFFYIAWVWVSALQVQPSQDIQGWWGCDNEKRCGENKEDGAGGLLAGELGCQRRAGPSISSVLSRGGHAGVIVTFLNPSQWDIDGSDFSGGHLG